MNNNLLLLALSVIILGNQMYAQENTLPITGNVGIGTLNPDARLNANENNYYDIEENSFAVAVRYFQLDSTKEIVLKPVILSEGDHGDGTYECSGNVGNKIDAMCMGFTGLCGFNFWNGKDQEINLGASDQSDTWPATIRAQQHMNGDDVINTLSNGNGGWIQGRQIEKESNKKNKVEYKELQYYISQNAEMAVGYVRNRTYNLTTKSINSDCEESLAVPLNGLVDIDWSDGPSSVLLWINGLKNNTDYNIDWYSFSDGLYLESDCQNTNGIKFKLN